MTTQTVNTRPKLLESARLALGLTPASPHYFFRRHSAVVRVADWINAICLAILLMSGLNIFNAHPALYLGQGSNFDHPAVMFGSMTDDAGNTVKGIHKYRRSSF